MNIQPHPDILIVAKIGDNLALECLLIAENMGFKTQIVKEDEYAPIGSIALYGGHNEQWPSRVFRVAAHTLYQGRPDWAVTTPFLVAVRKPNGKVLPAEVYRSAITDLVRMYTRWFYGQHGNDIPWEGKGNRRTTRREALEEWFDLVADALGHDRLVQIIQAQAVYDSIRGYGGDVVFNQLLYTGHVVLSGSDLPEGLPLNRVYRELLGFNGPVVSYGTSDIANTFELIQTLKLAHVLGLPAGFETYPGAHSWGYWYNGFFLPSLEMLGLTAPPDFLGLNPGSKYTAHVTRNKLVEGLKSVGLTYIAEEAGNWAGGPLWLIYRHAMFAVANEMMRLLGISVPFGLTTTEELCRYTGITKMMPDDLADKVSGMSGHSVVILNRPDGSHVYARQPMLPRVPVGELMEDGWWLGGAVLYHMIYSLSDYGGLVVMVKDSTAGRVNLLSRPYMEKPQSTLYLAPVGLFRLTASGQNEDWSVDPLVFLELLKRWGPEQARGECLKIWNAMEVPLRREHIGRKTIATITPGGVDIRIAQ